MQRPYTITRADWVWFYAVQQSGLMNMMEHPLIHLFMPEGAYDTAFKHFREDGRTDVVVIA